VAFSFLRDLLSWRYDEGPLICGSHPPGLTPAAMGMDNFWRLTGHPRLVRRSFVAGTLARWWRPGMPQRVTSMCWLTGLGEA
jgi:hypothetical protein